MGILSSRLHGEWARELGSTLEDRLRYTSSTTFATFPWPAAPGATEREAVAEAARALLEHRSAICEAESFGLTELFNLVDDGAWKDLVKLQRQLDQAVCRAYGWPDAAFDDRHDGNRRLLALNGEIAAGQRTYQPFRS